MASTDAEHSLVQYLDCSAETIKMVVQKASRPSAKRTKDVEHIIKWVAWLILSTLQANHDFWYKITNTLFSVRFLFSIVCSVHVFSSCECFLWYLPSFSHYYTTVYSFWAFSNTNWSSVKLEDIRKSLKFAQTSLQNPANDRRLQMPLVCTTLALRPENTPGTHKLLDSSKVL